MGPLCPGLMMNAGKHMQLNRKHTKRRCTEGPELPMSSTCGIEQRNIRRKKRQHEKEAIVEIEGCYNRNDVRKFYQKVKRTSQGYKPRTEVCKDQQGNIVVETQTMLRIWKDHFCNLYNGDDEANPAQRQIAPFNIDDEGQHFRPPDLGEVKAVISKLKSNKTAGAAELFKAPGDDLVRSMHQLNCRIWSERSMPTEWNLSIVPDP
ncbi:uncharacterized protein LOC129907077 [Episyrphus balteatus]|uniref:uncharacterized protein LOC129907077 n=1 Tax=Episyrphus balteatus TaxID=286459 RepID=UPI00248565CD|nr:uncharacterized protein LOC129907077 [Episyrphus balteatus]